MQITPFTNNAVETQRAEQYRKRTSTAQVAFAEIVDVYQKRMIELEAAADVRQQQSRSDTLNKLEKQMKEMEATMEKLQQGVGEHKESSVAYVQNETEARSTMDKAMEEQFNALRDSASGMQKQMNADAARRRLDQLEEDLVQLEHDEGELSIPDLDELEPYDYDEEQKTIAKLKEDAASVEDSSDRIWLEQNSLKGRVDAARAPEKQVLMEQLLERSLASATSAHRRAGTRLVRETGRATAVVIGGMESEFERVSQAAKLVTWPMRHDPRSTSQSAGNGNSQ